ncbi:hypothetical protein THAOC_24913 [Thalassiosira oceanica]|uniref:Uncharacterized protein n=1 Tax=Thalassiosira oceanica TaxID=159749 RepID=K0RQJ9_THAOC|nr:hypothetical protein THAOC_24913 [Thalassiosira oceanica]|eukprot:EJK55360.1 hypothetical protein THAOC_24913 [Thalassiosira oceanica]
MRVNPRARASRLSSSDKLGDRTNKTRLAEAPFRLVGDDNGPGSEPPPRNRIGIATAFVPSHRRSPSAPGKPSFPYFKSKQPRADAPFGRADDDNGPGSKPPIQDRIGLFTAVMPSRRRPSADVGKPSFPYFKADYLPDDVCRPRRPTIFRHRISATRWRTKDPKAWAQTAGIRRVVPSNPRRRRRIPSISSCCRNNFGRESDHSTYVVVVARSGKKSPPGTPQIQQVYCAINPLLAYALAPMHLSAFGIPRDSGKTTWEPTSSSTPTTTPSFCAEISGLEPPGTPQIQQVYCAMDPLLAYALAPMHLSAFGIPRDSGKTTWEPTSSSTPTTTPCFCAEISGFEPPGTPQIQQVYCAMDPLLAYTLAPMHLGAPGRTEN